ncbi:hypothetical protein [Fictibacillus sp. S7]|uniref:hypothetical protein n=1 Tax=Fictibacillus sp. S7 TaxID=2212476 RepID=UPI0019D7000D|nr:hypothetical protein [Fictibacillus sp. S7]
MYKKRPQGVRSLQPSLKKGAKKPQGIIRPAALFYQKLQIKKAGVQWPNNVVLHEVVVVQKKVAVTL